VTARVVIGVPTYNGSGTVQTALRSLLVQGGQELSIVVADDASTDDTVRLVAALAAEDDRVSLIVNPKRLGMVANWNATFGECVHRVPDARFFAWGSDHDVWLPGWLEALSDALDSNVEAVLAYPSVERVYPEGPISGDWRFNTVGEKDGLRRLGDTVRHGVAGDMIYGLFRVDALRHTRLYRDVVYPDRLLLAELALHGPFVQVPRILWSRRMGELSDPARQRSTLFAYRAPARTRLPWWLQHVMACDAGPHARAAYLRAASGVALRRPRAVVGKLLRSIGLRR
jgi:glycosyltransferase involved in cell wall biosynthesis